MNTIFDVRISPLFCFAVSGLSTSKEVRDIFIDLVEKVLEMCAAYGWRAAETEAFFAARMSQDVPCVTQLHTNYIDNALANLISLATVRTAFPKLTTVSTEFLCEMHPSWHRVVVGVQLAVARLFNDISVALQIAE